MILLFYCCIKLSFSFLSLENNDELFFIKTVPTPTVEERLEKKWREYFGGRTFQTYA